MSDRTGGGVRRWISGALALAALAGMLGIPAAAIAQTTVKVSTAAQLQSAVASANGSGGNQIIALADGTYTVTGTLHVSATHVTITSQSGIRENVIIQGDAMSANAAVQDLILADGTYFTLSNVTLQKAGWHLLQIAGESGADNALVHNVVFRDGYQQLLKVSVDQTSYAQTADNGVVEDSLFEYTAGIGPEYYIGGIDIHAGNNWIVRRNTFKSIISPDTTVAEFAVHVWDHSSNATVERNLIINCDRGIGFGLGNASTSGNTGGIIRNNMIYHDPNDGQFADVAIDLETSPGSQVYNNTIYTLHNYPNAIEYRFATTSGTLIVNNLANHAIDARDGATGTSAANVTNAAAAWFVNPSQGDLHLAAAVSGVVGVGQAVSGLTDDFDGSPRPSSGIDIGADQYASAIKPNPPTNVKVQ